MNITSLFTAALTRLPRILALGMIVAASAMAARAAGTVPATAKKFTPAQLKEVDLIVQGVTQGCSQNPLLASKVESIRMIGQWSSTPGVCACQGKMLRSILTPEVLALNRADQHEFFMNFAMAKSAECSVPAFKEQFSASCESFFAASFKAIPPEKLSATLAGRGYANLDAYIANTCSCLRPAVQKISIKDWVDGSLAAYNAYLERKRTGNQSIPTPRSAFDQVVDQCIAPPAAKDAKAIDAAPAAQSVDAPR